MSDVWSTFIELTQQQIPPSAHLLVPIVILIVGWLLALIASALLRGLFRRVDLDERLGRAISGPGAAPKAEAGRWIARGAYYFIMLFVLVAFFQNVGLTMVTQPLNQVLIQVFEFIPRLLSAGLLLLVAWVVASLLRMLVTRVLTAARVDERLADPAGLDPADPHLIARSIGNAAYWVIFLVFLPAILSTLELEGLLRPVRDMVGEAMGYLPNLFAAGLILLAGWMAARIIQRIVANLLVATGIDRAGERAGLESVTGGQGLSGLAGLVVYSLILMLAAIAALDALQLDAISGPASRMLTTIFSAVPAIFTAVLMLLVAYLVGRFVARLATNLLAQLGFDRLLARLGVTGGSIEPGRRFSESAGYLVMVAVLLFAAIEAAGMLGFVGVQQLLIRLAVFAGQVAMALVIFGFGLYVADLAARIVGDRAATASGLLSTGVRVAILTLSTAMALREMGIANEIITTAFGLILGAIAVAVALAFGLGGREIAADQIQRWRKSVKKQADDEAEPD